MNNLVHLYAIAISDSTFCFVVCFCKHEYLTITCFILKLNKVLFRYLSIFDSFVLTFVLFNP